MTNIEKAKEFLEDMYETVHAKIGDAEYEEMTTLRTALQFYEDYQNSKPTKKPITDKGIAIILAMREVEDWITAKSLGEQMDISGRSVSGSLKKLVTDGYVDKRAGNPAAYKITEKGMTCNLEIEEN